MSYKNFIIGLSIAAGLLISASSQANEYAIDTRGMHASIQFKVKHLGYSWLDGRFNSFSGQFSFDQNKPAEAQVNVVIDTASLDSNHAERDKHLRSDDFLAADQFPQASFISTAAELDAEGHGHITGDFTLKGITKSIRIAISSVGAGNDPWGGYRRGFTGITEIQLKDFGIDYDLGAATTSVYLTLNVEGIRQ